MHRRAFILVAVGLAAALAPRPVPAQNLLEVDQITRSFGVIREQRLVDGIVPGPESPIDDFTTTLFLVPRAEVLFGLDRIEAKALRIVAFDDGVSVEASVDGQRFFEVPLRPAEPIGGLRSWSAVDLPHPLSAIRLRLRDGREMGAVGELMLFSKASTALPIEFQDPPSYQQAVDRLLNRQTLDRRISIGVGFLLLPLLVFAIRTMGRPRLIACLAMVVIAPVVWLGFGTMHGNGSLIHPLELTHYYVGSKYFRELRYQELYRCIAAHERQQGRQSMIDRGRIRNLDDYEVHPGSWSWTPDGGCRTEFSSDRWISFGKDVDRLRRLFRYRHFHGLVNDHGYNATPFQTLVFQQLTDQVHPHRGSLRFLAILDLALLGLSVAMIAWAFGPLPGAVAALLIAFGHAWEMAWIAGSLGRFLWLAALLSGLAFLKKRRPSLGVALVVISGLLRLFPLVLLAGLGCRLFGKMIAWNLRGDDRRIAVGIIVTLLVGLALPLLFYGGDVYLEFYENCRLHASRPPGNDLGFERLLSFGLSESGEGMSVGFLLGRAAWGLGILAAALLVILVERRGASHWELVVWSGPLLFASLPLSGYDYVWLALFAPVLVARGTRAVLAVLLIVLGKLTPALAAGVYGQHRLINILLLVGLVALVIDEVLCLRSRGNRELSGAERTGELPSKR